VPPSAEMAAFTCYFSSKGRFIWTKIVSMAKQMDDENRGDVSSTRAEHQQLKFEVTTVDT
jgi:hypothetical protein